MNLQAAGSKKQVEYIPVDRASVPYSFDIKLDDRTFTLCFRYNDQGGFYTVDLSITATGEVLCYGDPVRYGRPMFRSVEDERFPIPVIIPYCLTGDEREVTKDNLGRTVQLYLHERKSEDNVSILDQEREYTDRQPEL